VGKTIYWIIDGLPVVLIAGACRPPEKRIDKKIYSPAMILCLATIQAIFDCMRCKRLRVFLRENIEALMAHAGFDISALVAKELITVSPATISSLLALEKHKLWFINSKI